MLKKNLYAALFAFSLLVCAACGKTDATSSGSTDIKLPPVTYNYNTSLAEALKNRKSQRAFSDTNIEIQTISNLLWSAYGINRENGRRTAPSALNRQEISLYVIFSGHAYLYEPKNNILKIINNANMKVLDFNAPLTIILTANLAIQEKDYATVDCGFIGENIYLFASANKLNTVFQGSVDRPKIHKALKLNKAHEVMFIQKVGYPKEKH